MKKSSKITKVLCALATILTLNFAAPAICSNAMAADDESVHAETVKEIMGAYEDDNVQIGEGLTLTVGRILDYRKLVHKEEEQDSFELGSSDEDVVSVDKDGYFVAVSPGGAFITLKSGNNVLVYEVEVVGSEQQIMTMDAADGESYSNEPVTAAVGTYTVYVDAGHGGSETGAYYAGTAEKNLNLSIAQKVQLKLMAKGINVIMRRTDDTYMNFRDIGPAANATGADAFVSIHNNATGTGSGAANGIESYWWSRTESYKLASSVQSNLIKNTGAKNRGVKENDISVVVKTTMPATLVECGYMDNPGELIKLKTDSYQNLLAQGIADGMESYLKANVPLVKTNGTRIAGNNRYSTSYAIAGQGWGTSADTAVIAYGLNFPDALCAAPLAKAYNAPILLAQNSGLDSQQDLKSRLQSLNVKKVFIVGGEGVLPPQLESDINNLGIKTQRLAGYDRYETSAAVADAVVTKVGNKGEVALAYGLGFADALSMSSVAANSGMPILLTETNEVPKATMDAIKSLNPSKTYVIGGTGVVSEAVLNSLKNSSYNPERISGDNRYLTNIAVYNKFSSRISLNNIYMAQSMDFPDALSISALAAKNNSFVLLSNLKTAEDPIINFMNKYRSNITRIYVLGGPAVITDSTLTRLGIGIENTISK